MSNSSKTIFISGASSGIGEAASRLFAHRGWNVVASMRSPDAAPDWMKHQKNLLVLKRDVTDARGIAGAVETAQARFETINVLLNNAGYGLHGPMEGASDKQKRQQ